MLFKANTRMHSDSATLAAGNAAIGLWFRCGCWSAEHHRNGFIPDDIARLYAGRDQIKALLAAGLWTQVDGGYQMDWTGNPTATEIQASRLATKSRVRRHRNADVTALQDPPVTPLHERYTDVGNAVTSALQVARGTQARDAHAVPTRDISLGTYRGGSLETPSPDSAGILPEPRCPQHMETPATGPCAACGNARRNHTEAAREQRRGDARRRSMEAHAHTTARNAEIAHCGLCDEHGYKPTGAVCPHDPDQATRAKKGAQTVREALRQTRSTP